MKAAGNQRTGWSTHAPIIDKNGRSLAGMHLDVAHRDCPHAAIKALRRLQVLTDNDPERFLATSMEMIDQPAILGFRDTTPSGNRLNRDTQQLGARPISRPTGTSPIALDFEDSP